MTGYMLVLLGAITLCSAQDVKLTTTTATSTVNNVLTQDHLLGVLHAIHNSKSFHQLPSTEKIIAVELLAAAEVDQVTHYIDQIGFARILLFLDHVTKISAVEAHLLEKYLEQELNQESGPHFSGSNVIGRKRDLQSFIARIQKNTAYQHLPTSEQQLLVELARAAETGGLTPVIHREGYSRIIKLIEDLSTVQETHAFITYLVQHLNAEASHAAQG